MIVLSPRRLLLVLSATFFALVPFLSACGGNDVKSVDAEDWVADVCDRFIEFDEDVDEIGEQFSGTDFDDAEAAKKDVLAFLAEMKKEFDNLREDFKKTGQPDIDGGSAVTEAFLANFKSVEKDIDGATKKIKALDTGSRDFQGDVVEVFDEIEDENFRDVLEKLADKKDDVWEIVDLIDEDPKCATVIFTDE